MEPFPIGKCFTLLEHNNNFDITPRCPEYCAKITGPFPDSDVTSTTKIVDRVATANKSPLRKLNATAEGCFSWISHPTCRMFVSEIQRL